MPDAPFSAKHLNKIMGDEPMVCRVAGKCPAANKRAEIMLAITKMVVVGFSVFLPKNLCKSKAINDIKKSLTMISSTTAPYVTEANTKVILGFRVYDSAITAEC